MSYNPGGPLPRLLDYDALRSGKPLAVDSTRCVIFTEPNDGPVQSVLEDLKRRYPDGRLFTFTDWAGKGRVAIFARGAGG